MTAVISHTTAVNWWSDGTATAVVSILLTTIVAAALGAKRGWSALMARLDQIELRLAVRDTATDMHRDQTDERLDKIEANVNQMGGCIRKLAVQIARDCGGRDVPIPNPPHPIASPDDWRV